MTKRSLAVLLAGLNMLLLGILLLGSYRLPAAAAQAGRRGGDFLAATVTAPGQSYEVLYIVDLPDRKMHAFVPDSQRHLQYANFVDLMQDFRQP
jgi:hypothetical protein